MAKNKSRWLAQEPTFELFDAIAKGDTGWVKQLLEMGADANTNTGTTPLHCAVEWRHLECVVLLLEFEADINATDDSGQTALRKAIETSHTYQIYAPDIARVLIEHGANVHIRTGSGSISQEALRSVKANSEDKELIEMLKSAGATL